MHPVLQNLQNELTQLSTAVRVTYPDDRPFNIIYNNWSFPALSPGELIDKADELAHLIKERGSDELGRNDIRLKTYEDRLSYLRSNVVPNIGSNPPAAVPIFLTTLDGLEYAVSSALIPLPNPDADAIQSTRRIAARIRSIEASLSKLEPRSANLTDMVERIEQAHDAADRLPTDLQSLDEAREEIRLVGEKVNELLNETNKESLRVSDARVEIDGYVKRLEASANEAETIISRSEAAYSTATSQGLAAAFHERSKALDWSMWFWVISLVIALSLGAFFGSERLALFANLINNPAVPAGTIILNLILSLCAIGGPIWFAWLATKQVGQRFRLSEDYAFKASVSRAYEGYRREAAKIDKDMEASLLASALARLDEQPLRLVESASYGSPWHELLSSDVVKEAVKLIPGFADRISDIARDALNARRNRRIASSEPQDQEPLDQEFQ